MSGRRRLRAVNLNLLPVMRELLRKRNVTHAAEALLMSQPAVSEALGRLRHLFQDDILVAKGRQFELTPLAERLRPMLETSLDQIEVLLSTPVFDPLEVKGSVKVATADYVVSIFGTELLKRLRTAAPRLTVHFIDITPQSIDELRSNEIDFILTPASAAMLEFERHPLFEDEAVCVVPADSPIKGTIAEKDFWSARHAAFSPGGTLSASLHAQVLQEMGREEFNAVVVQSFMLLPFLVSSTGTIAIVPRLLAQRLAPMAKVRIANLPFSFPKLRIFAFWNRAKSQDPAHHWFREFMSEVPLPNRSANAAASAAITQARRGPRSRQRSARS